MTNNVVSQTKKMFHINNNNKQPEGINIIMCFIPLLQNFHFIIKK